LSARTVETHVTSVFTKLGLTASDTENNRVRAVLTFLRLGGPRSGEKCAGRRLGHDPLSPFVASPPSRVPLGAEAGPAIPVPPPNRGLPPPSQSLGG